MAHMLQCAVTVAQADPLVPRFVVRLIAAVLLALFFAIAMAFYRAFPGQRKEICIGCIAFGFAGMLAGAIFSWVAENETRDEYGIIMLIVMGFGFLLAVTGYRLIRVL